MIRSKLKSFVLLLIMCIAISVSSIGCSLSPKKAKNFIWKASEGKNVIYLTGTMHLAPAGYVLVSDRLNSIIKETDGIAIEFNVNDKQNIDKMQRVLLQKSVLENGSIEQYLSGGEVKKLKLILHEYGIDYEKSKEYSTYGLISNIESRIAALSGLNTTGLDAALLYNYQKDGKIIYEIEGLDYQLDLVDKIFTIDKLKQYINEYKEGYSKEVIDQNKSLVDLYMNGDPKFLSEFPKQDSFETMGNNYNIFIKDRNINIVKKIGQLANSGKKYLVAVGAGHYTGEDSIIKELEKIGYTVETLN